MPGTSPAPPASPRIRSFTLDLEERRAPDRPSRVEGVVDRLLDFLSARSVRATVFVVGDLAEERPAMVRRIADAGHEIGYHSRHHEFLRDLTPAAFVEVARADRLRLADLTGTPVVGYRAPFFSLTRDTPWAPRAIEDAGFAYSSSVVPAPNPVAGFPGAPATPFRWHGSLVEFPCPVGGVGRYRIPFAGGVYLRALPLALIRRFLARSPAGGVPWAYCHPYDFDPGSRWWRMPGDSRAQTAVLALNRGRMFARLDALLAGADVAPLCDIAAAPGFAGTLPAFAP